MLTMSRVVLPVDFSGGVIVDCAVGESGVVSVPDREDIAPLVALAGGDAAKVFLLLDAFAEAFPVGVSVGAATPDEVGDEWQVFSDGYLAPAVSWAHPFPQPRYMFAADEGSHPALLARMAEVEESSEIRRRLLTNKSTPDAARWALAARMLDDREAIEFLLTNSRVPGWLLEWIIESGSHFKVRAQVARHRNTSDGLLVRLSRDRSAAVRDEATVAMTLRQQMRQP